MKTLQKICLITVCLFSLSGCSATDKLSADLNEITNGAEEKIGNVREKADAIKNDISEAKENVDQKIEDVKTATREVNEAVDAVGQIVGGEEEAETTKE